MLQKSCLLRPRWAPTNFRGRLTQAAPVDKCCCMRLTSIGFPVRWRACQHWPAHATVRPALLGGQGHTTQPSPSIIRTRRKCLRQDLCLIARTRFSCLCSFLNVLSTSETRSSNALWKLQGRYSPRRPWYNSEPLTQPRKKKKKHKTVHKNKQQRATSCSEFRSDECSSTSDLLTTISPCVGPWQVNLAQWRPLDVCPRWEASRIGRFFSR